MPNRVERGLVHLGDAARVCHVGVDVHPADLFSDGRARIVGEVSDNDVSSFEREPDGTRAGRCRWPRP